jgi:hypothetical protein
MPPAKACELVAFWSNSGHVNRVRIRRANPELRIGGKVNISRGKKPATIYRKKCEMTRIILDAIIGALLLTYVVPVLSPGAQLLFILIGGAGLFWKYHNYWNLEQANVEHKHKKPRFRPFKMKVLLGVLYIVTGCGFMAWALRPAHADNFDAMYRLGYTLATPNERTVIFLTCIDLFEKQEQEDERRACEKKLFADFGRDGHL